MTIYVSSEHCCAFRLKCCSFFTHVKCHYFSFLVSVSSFIEQKLPSFFETLSAAAINSTCTHRGSQRRIHDGLKSTQGRHTHGFAFKNGFLVTGTNVGSIHMICLLPPVLSCVFWSLVWGCCEHSQQCITWRIVRFSSTAMETQNIEADNVGSVGLDVAWDGSM